MRAKVSFSSCGTRILVESLGYLGERLVFNLDHIEADQTLQRYISSNMWGDKATLTTEDGLYGLDTTDEWHTGLWFVGPDEPGYYKYDKSLRVELPELSIGKGDLLLGRTDDDNMRLLIEPRHGRLPEIKIIPLTFRQAREKLQQLWKDKHKSPTPPLVKTTASDAPLPMQEMTTLSLSPASTGSSS